MRAALVTLASITALGCVCSTAVAQRALVVDGQARSAIVLDRPDSERAQQAADELVYHVLRATGVALPRVGEDAIDLLPDEHTLVVIGGGERARSLGLPVEDLREEEYLVRTVGRHVVFVGYDTAGDEEERVGTSPATRWAVGHFLDRQMGVRWLWPGEVGTFVPEAATILVPDFDVRDRPEMVTRRFTSALTARDATDARVTSAEVRERMTAEIDEWNDRQQTGMRERMQAGHSFRHWWEKYHEEHPEIFATLPEGMTQPNPQPDRVKLCVSNPLVEEFALQEWREAGRPDVWPVGPNDGQGYCVCDDCRALDIPDTLDADPLDIFWNRSVVSLTGRYLDLWRRLLDTMRAENPDVTLTTLAYANYRLAHPEMEPLGHEDALTISLVPDNWSDEEYQSLAEWERIGATVVMRPNFFFVGYAAPYLPLRDAGRFWEHAVDTGIVGWFSNMLGYWGSQGPYYYLVARLCARPDLSVEEVLAEYTSAFGEAAPAIEEYLAYWEGVTEWAAFPDWAGRFQRPGGFYERTLTELGLRIHPFWGSWYIMPALYTDERLAPAYAILDRAATLTGDDEMALKRIEFLRDGLRHLELTRDVVELANEELRPEVDGPEAIREQQRQFELLLARLRNMRADLNLRHVVWADSIDGHEQRRVVKISDRYADAWASTVVPPDAWGQWRFRSDPDGVGVGERWYADDAAAEWTPITVPAHWDDTIGSYQGFGWYRTTLRMPEEWAHDAVALTFGSVDEQAWVYVNGRLVGEHTIESESTVDWEATIGELYSRAFTIEVPVDQLRLGEGNTLVVRVHNEVGAGGITGRVTVQPPMQPSELLFLNTDELGEGTQWLPEESYTSLSMARRASGRVDVTVHENTGGVIMEAGADGGGLALYVHEGTLYFQCGRGHEFRAEEQAVIELPIEPGRHLIEWSADSTRSRAMLRIDGEIAGVSDDPIYGSIAGGDPGGIGRIHGAAMARNAAGWYRSGEGEFTGTIHSATVWPDKVCF
ncbi:MAG: DUF4838 domain-containing protein [Armatimonadota bacterium]|jgi:hypothetical protein